MLFYTTETMWNRDTRRPVLLALTPTEWQYYKGWVFIQGLNLRARLQGTKITFEQAIDASQAGQEIFYEFRSAAWCTNAAGDEAKQRFDADDDICLFNQDLMTENIKWRLKQQRGLEFQSDKLDYMVSLRTHMGNDNAGRRVHLGGRNMPYMGVNVPDGNFGM